jgi:sialic acid synthase SpsE/mannose-6-phosphate isomerase-like protein (cupin superfamily)
MTQAIPNPLFVLEMANNHMGNLDHGIAVIRAFGEVCRAFPFSFAFKLQYRDLDTFIHPSVKDRDDIKYVKRFSETRLSRADFDTLVAEIRNNGFLAMSTPFDEPSVDVIEDQNLDFIKIASCSFTDWPLMERIAQSAKPIIASTAGANLDELDRVVSFLMHRSKEFAILHCVGEYPTADADMHLSQIDFLKNRYPEVRIGFSTHENPGNTNIIQLAIAKGATIFEKHVGLPTEKNPNNAYSANPEQIRAWLQAAVTATTICGVGNTRLPPNPRETASLQSLRRGVFVRKPVTKGQMLDPEDIYFAFPPNEGQFTANDWSKYAVFTASADIPADGAITPKNTDCTDRRAKIWEIAQRVKAMLNETHIAVPGSADLEISHHFGLDEFERTGLVLITIVNRGYCKKLLVSLPGQEHPEQWHNEKEETFHILSGEVHMRLDGQLRICNPGDVVTVEPGVRHAFVSPTGAVIEEISTTHFKNDSFYTDERINQNKNRKTLLTYWMV